MQRMGPNRAYDMVATVADQVYGGVNAETPLGNQAVDATAGLLLLYDGQVVNAPYHATCGGSTAEPGDAWRARAEPYLKRVSDEIPGTGRYYCDWAPKYRWTRVYSAEELRESIARYLRTLPGGRGGGEQVLGASAAGGTPAARARTIHGDPRPGRRA